MVASRRAGRPHDPQIEHTLRATATRLLRASPYAALKIEALCEQAGVAKRSYSRRYQSLGHLVLDAVIERYGDNAQATTGSLRDDLIAMQVREVQMLTDPFFAHALPGLLVACDANPHLAKAWAARFITPRRQSVARVIRAAVNRGEIAQAPFDLDAICDDLIGPLLVRATLPATQPLDEALALRTADRAYREIAGEHRVIDTEPE